MTFEISIKKYKIHNLQIEYKKISQTIYDLQTHIDSLNNELFIDTSFKNSCLGKLFIISKNLNSSYNNYIIDECNSEIEEEQMDLDSTSNDENKSSEINSDNDNIINLVEVSNEYNGILKFLEDKDTKSDIELFDKIRNFVILSGNINLQLVDSKDILLFDEKTINPLKSIKEDIKLLLKETGFINIIESIKLFTNEHILKNLNSDIIEEINFYNNIFVPVSVNITEIDSPKIVIIEKLKDKHKNDYLDKLFTIYLKIDELHDKYIVFTGFIRNDNINIFLKSSQISNKGLYIKKKNITELLNQKKIINKKFKKTYLKNMLLSELLINTEDEFCDMVNKYYNQYMELSNKSFMNIMKEFIGKSSSIKSMYDTIRLLLMGTDENENVASLLYGLTKEKKVGGFIISDIIYNNLNYSSQLKIKKANINLKEEMEKIKSLTIEDIDYKKQILSLSKMPLAVKSLALEKAEEMKSSNNEYYKQLTFVKCLIKYPWSSASDDAFYKNLKEDAAEAKHYITNVENKLFKLSYGHTEVKKSLLQLIGKWISNPSSSGGAIALVGPPGVGKTLLAKSVGSALGIPFAQITLGGQNDGELLHGHGYTYSGSQPGMIIRKMIETGQSRCILYFDELDKACSKHGTTNEITSILIHLTDPNMNKSFQDRFFQGIDFPLDKVIMIFSYNDSSLIDPILIDRFKEIQVKPYNVVDKLSIVKNYIIPEIKNNVGFNEYNLIFNDDLIEYLIENYTNEAGVRGIKRTIENIFLKLNLDKLYQKGIFSNKSKSDNIEITEDLIIDILSKPDNDILMVHDKPEYGIVNGLYATSIGTGGIVPIQVFKNYSISNCDFQLKLTGKQGKVMKESVHCSYTAAIDYIRRHIDKFPNISDIDEHIKQYYPYGLHIHAPSTSTPKDGPSAGGAFCSAIISRIANIKLNNEIAMTGEIDLRGCITKIGGLTYKLQGAKKAGVKIALVPKENEKDYIDIIKNNKNLIDENFKVHIIESIDDIMGHIIVKD
jgi:endopeptidase La